MNVAEWLALQSDKWGDSGSVPAEMQSILKGNNLI